MASQNPGGGGTATPYIDYNQGPYSSAGIQEFLKQMTGGRWTNEWQDPTMTSSYVRPGGASIDFGSIKGLADKAINDFTQQVQSVTGQAPTADQISQFFSSQLNPMTQTSQPGGYDPIKPTDITSAIQSYIPSAFSKDIQNYQTQQQTEALNKNIGTGQGLIDKNMESFISNMSDPTNPMYQAFAGNMNNLGITPSSGAFQAGMGGAIANRKSDLDGALMSSLGFPALGGIQNLSNQSNSNMQRNAMGGLANLTSQANSLSDFGRQQALISSLMEQMQPSAFEKGLGYANSAGSIFGNVAGPGMALGSQMTSYVCKELIKRGLLCESDMDDFHIHIMPAMFKKGRAFWKYAMDGYKLVQAVNKRGLNWEVFKPLLFDRVMEEKDPCKAVDLYADACHQLCISSDSSLWDPKVYRTSTWDSLLFLPRLLIYKPFLQALWKSIRVKTLLVYDKPKCGVHYVAR